MDPNYRASEEQWAVLEQVNDANDEDRDLLQDLADWAVLSCILELRARIEALEAAQQPDHLPDATEMVNTGWQNMADGSPIMEPAPPAPADGLVERVAWRLADHNHDTNPEIWRPEARAAIREVAAATDQMAPDRNLTWERVALWLEREAER